MVKDGTKASAECRSACEISYSNDVWKMKNEDE